MEHRKLRRAGAVIAIAGVAATGLAACGNEPVSAAPRLEGNQVVIPIDGGMAEVDTTSLAVGATASGQRMELSGPADGGLGAPGPVRVEGAAATWSYPERGLAVRADAADGRLRIEVSGERDGKLVWPVTGGDRDARSLQLPRGEGLSLPVRDTFWNGPDTGLVGESLSLTAGLTMPFWGYRIGERGVSYVVPTDIGSSVTVRSEDGRLLARGEHDFAPGRGTGAYRVDFALTDASPVAAARDYRDWLLRHGEFRSLTDKIAENPAVGKLLGAFHAYLWGDGRGPEAVAQLRKLGIDRMWLGYDADGDPMSADAVREAGQAGYLVGPYDSFDNAQDPATADNPSSRWPGRLWPEGCVHDADGTPETGFGGRGCYLSTEVLQQDPQLYRDRYAAMTANGADSYFLDVDAAGEFFDDYSAGHPMTQTRDRANRLERMRWLASDRKTVLGSESAGAWSAPVLAFDHGAQNPISDRLWKLQRDKQTWGAYYPAQAPKAFFQPVDLPADLVKAMFDPVYRVPLYETVLHDSLVNADRWELSYYKLPQQRTMRALTAILNNTPLNFALDRATIGAHGAEIARLQQFFAPLHEAAGTLAMTDFRWLTDDRLVQRSVFGDGKLTVTANFGTQDRDGLPGGCVDAQLAGDETPRRLCPAR
ncbi:glycoside hydrolase [Nocardia yamanashiensis]|uniref:glycoside hydrolase n=1 Tax=Nocardia yamanashiensis TaxID=209247 RepID=UPI001E54D43B|nr:glycoside hydrolase [Nocardia yamanashiensis]UGT44708.1 glycoside hydrolase [Nocardia yamanashiensis]